MIRVRVFKDTTPVVNGEIEFLYRNDYSEAMVPEGSPYWSGKIVVDESGNHYFSCCYSKNEHHPQCPKF